MLSNQFTLVCNQRIDKYAFGMKNVLGEGQYAKVVLGYEDSTGNLVAVKITDLQRVRGSTLAQKLIQREINILQAIRDKNIVQLYDIFQTENYLYMFMEYCPGGDLKSLLKKRGNKLSVIEALKCFQDIVSGFKVLYDNKIIHRDIKPANIMINKGNCMITDFGFARCLEEIDMEKQYELTLLGTPLYMSPQILNEEKFSSKCDVWSVGLLFFQMIYGHTPWIGKTSEQLYYNIINNPLVFPPDPIITDDIKNMIIKMLIVKDEERISWSEIFVDKLMSINLKSEQVPPSKITLPQEVQQIQVNEILYQSVQQQKDQQQ